MGRHQVLNRYDVDTMSISILWTHSRLYRGHVQPIHHSGVETVMRRFVVYDWWTIMSNVHQTISTISQNPQIEQTRPTHWLLAAETGQPLPWWHVTRHVVLSPVSHAFHFSSNRLRGWNLILSWLAAPARAAIKFSFFLSLCLSVVGCACVVRCSKQIRRQLQM